MGVLRKRIVGLNFVKDDLMEMPVPICEKSWYELVYISCMVGTWLIHVDNVNDTNLFMLNPIYFSDS